MTSNIVDDAIVFVKNELKRHPHTNSHTDWLHIERVLKLAEHIAKTEYPQCDLELVRLGCCLYELNPFKYDYEIEMRPGLEYMKPVYHHNSNTAAEKLNEFLGQYNHTMPNKKILLDMICNLSWRKLNNNNAQTALPDSDEFKILHDATRLESIGAVGLVRFFNKAGRHVSFPLSSANMDKGKDLVTYFVDKASCVEKNMKTKTGAELATRRAETRKIFIASLMEEVNFLNNV